MHMEIIIQSNNGKICNNGEISAAVKIHVGGDEKLNNCMGSLP